MATLPGVARTSLASNIPLRSHVAGIFHLPGRKDLPQLPSREAPYVDAVTPGFFATTGMRILQGRDFLENERNRGNVIAVNETMARLYWPGRSPIGECVNLEPNICTTVVGVVADSRKFGLVEESPYLYWYRPMAVAEKLSYFLQRSLLVRMAPGAGRPDNAIRKALLQLDPDLPFIRIETLGRPLDSQIRPWRLGALVFTAFGILALALAMIGLWSSVSHAVSQRTREFAIRTAVGADRRSLVGLVLKEGMRNAIAAVAAGLVVAYVSNRFISDLLYRVSPADPLVYVSVTGMSLAIAILASLAPAFRAARIDPAHVLRTD